MTKMSLSNQNDGKKFFGTQNKKSQNVLVRPDWTGKRRNTKTHLSATSLRHSLTLTSRSSTAGLPYTPTSSRSRKSSDLFTSQIRRSPNVGIAPTVRCPCGPINNGIEAATLNSVCTSEICYEVRDPKER